MVFVGSDFNSRIGTQNDFIIENEKDLNYLPQGYELDTIRSVRNNQDTSVNGQQLLDLYIETKLKILNGRKRGDLQALDIYRFSWLQYSRFSFNIRSISGKAKYSPVSFQTFLSLHGIIIFFQTKSLRIPRFVN